ncbi:MAG: AAA family ATPase, partial [Desulfococcaceae bacterium]
MIFNRIILKNVFAYQFADIKLDGAKKGKNIVLIQGRNNFGKTSIINAVKLLFVGPNREMCLSVQQGRELKPKQYVQGLGEDWMGILNRRAKRAGKTNCSVKIFWEEEGFEAVEATRSWRIRESSFDEKLEVDLEGERQIHIEGEDAQKFLNERLPEDFLPFFFFDGEQIQRIA